ncbi:MAG: hypothetical protein GTO45_37210 [Candidatus Aminicenantes bacterium]|nr:hypothetical protein [Candidatus Aminicenantes bacterium]NIM84306.1 hypothetical protein [Candidatus Aminicenantes bacterium]NIN23792.1 hypothetical protein [Candidatus Aminicenantes bacterium]NIN47508.1 hypothetical protein [Candidatus Aminicenantes bacterium]NIN90428.1 hypothetical protein [Candidatus Aminicenantes bacterium]
MKRKKSGFSFKIFFLITALIGFMQVPAFGQSPPTLDGKLDPVYLSHAWIVDWDAYDGSDPTDPDPNAPDARVYILSNQSIDPNYIWVVWSITRNFNDNSYGTGKHSSWGGTGHIFDDLLESDMQRLAISNKCKVTVLDASMDLLDGPPYHIAYGTPSGYDVNMDATESVKNYINGDDWTKFAYQTSLSYNLNDLTLGFCTGGVCGCGTTADLLTNSPAWLDEPNYIPEAGCTGWEYTIMWELRIDRTVFDTGTCPDPDIDWPWVEPIELHASPSKSVRHPPVRRLELDIGNYIWQDINGDGVQDVNEPGIPNVTVELYSDADGDGDYSTDGTLLDTQTTDADGYYMFHLLGSRNFVVVVTDANGMLTGYTSTTNNSPLVLSESVLLPGTKYLDADFGYAHTDQTRAVIGDYIWSDANENGIQDPGEPGIGNVTIDLLADDGSKTWPIVVATTTTTDDGYYHFMNVEPGEYKIKVTDTNNVLNDYSPTSGPYCSVDPSQVIQVAAGDKMVCADFGYFNPNLGSIGNQLWLEADADGLFEAGEVGISDVTLNLVKDTNGNGAWDAGERVISTITSYDGTYLFTGLSLSDDGDGDPSDADYLVVITDRNLIVQSLNLSIGPTPGSDNNSQEDPYAVVLTAASPDNLTADFGFHYNTTRGVVGDTVWYDLNGDGVQDDGEEGIEGVELELWVLQGSNFSDTGLRTTTDTKGNYFFTQVENAKGGQTYQVRVADSNFTTGPLQGMTRTNPDPDITPEPGSDRWSESFKLTTTNPQDLSLDFGYYFGPSGTTYSISGIVWADENEDGGQSGEDGIPDVTLALYRDSNGDGDIDPDEPLIATTSTDDAIGFEGTYSFTGLANGNYIVTITDDLNRLEGSKQTFNYPQTPGPPAPSPPFSTTVAVTISGASISNVDFGFNPFCEYTLAFLSSFQAYSDNGQVVVHWETASEASTAGFYLFRQDKANNRFQQLNKDFLPGLLHSHQGGVYRYVDHSAFPGETYTYRLVEVEFNGDRRNHGPFTITVGAPPQEIDLEPMQGIYSKKPHKIFSARNAARLRARQMDKQTARIQKKSRVGNEVKIVVKEKGLYHLDSASIANMLGMSPKQVEQRIRNLQFILTNWGREIAYLPADGNSGIYFYGEPIDSLYTNENIYWLEKGKGLVMESVYGGLPSPGSGQETFMDTFHLEEEHYALTALFNDPGDDYWMWDYIVAGSSGKFFNFYAPGAAASGTASLTVYLHGATDTTANPDHHVKVSLNGTWIGESQWNGKYPHRFTISLDQSLIIDGVNTIEVTGILPGGVPYSIFYVDYFDLDYHRHYRAVNNRLMCRGGENPVVTIEGFTDSNIKVFDVTDPLQPKLVTGTTLDLTHTNRVSFKPSSPESMYAAVSTYGAQAPFSAFANKASGLKKKENKADYVVIVPEGLEEAARGLTNLRQEKGMDAIVVELEDIYDEFNYGSPSPEAIKDFLTYAYHNWNKNGPQYVVLAGEGTFDYKNIMGHGDNLVPPMLVGTSFGLFASDTWFADVMGNDGIPEMAIGRLPVMSAAELQAYIDKLSDYEYSGGEWTNRVLMLADNPDSAGDFPADSNYLSSLFTGYTVEKIHLSDFPTVDEARQAVLEGFNNGAVLVNYIGHAGLDRLAFEKLLWSGDVPSLQNGDKLPIMTAMTCVVGRFGIPGYDSLSEALVLKSNGGVVAMWAPTGLSLNYLARILAEKFFTAAFQAQEKTIGKALLKAMADYAASDGQPFMLYIYALLGDPALEIK